MFDRWMEKTNFWLDSLTGFLWQLFEKDMRMAEGLIQRTEHLFVSIESKMPNGLRRFFSGPTE